MHAVIHMKDRIQGVYGGLRPSEKKVADFLLRDLQAAAGLSITELASRAQVSQPTIIRFARALGFGGYREFRFVLLHEGKEAACAGAGDPLSGLGLHPWNRVEEVPRHVCAQIASRVQETLEAMTPSEYHRAVSLLAHAHAVLLFGVGPAALPGGDLLRKLTCLGIPCRLIGEEALLGAAVRTLAAGDTVLAFCAPGCGERTVPSLRMAGAAGAQTILVTCTADERAAGAADVCLCAEAGAVCGGAPLSLPGYFAVCDMLYAGILLSDYELFSKRLLAGSVQKSD